MKSKMYITHSDGRLICGGTEIYKATRRKSGGSGDAQYVIKYVDSSQAIGVVEEKDLLTLAEALIDLAPGR